MRRADAVVVVAEAFRAQIEAYGVDPAGIHTVPNWSHIHDPAGIQTSARRAMGWPEGLTVALHTGKTWV